MRLRLLFGICILLVILPVINQTQGGLVNAVEDPKILIEGPSIPSSIDRSRTDLRFEFTASARYTCDSVNIRVYELQKVNTGSPLLVWFSGNQNNPSNPPVYWDDNVVYRIDLFDYFDFTSPGHQTRYTLPSAEFEFSDSKGKYWKIQIDVFWRSATSCGFSFTYDYYEVAYIMKVYYDKKDNEGLLPINFTVFLFSVGVIVLLRRKRLFSVNYSN